MDKVETDAKDILKKLGEFSSYLANLEAGIDREECFKIPLIIIRQTMSFDVSILYEISNVVDNLLILNVTQIFDPEGYRADLAVGKKLVLDLDNPDPLFINEVKAYISSSVSFINVPNEGCDMVGYIYLPEGLGNGFLFGGDYCGHESSVKDYEASVCEIMCNLLSTKLVKSQFELWAVYDSLTGLRNSKSIKDEVALVCKRFDRKTGSTAVIAMCDVDHFKKVNDTYGHIQGDLVLEELGKIISESMRKHFDVAGRYGGEEFLLLFDETTVEESLMIVERIREKIATYPFTKCDSSGCPIEGQSLSITVSFGIAGKNGDGEIRDEVEWITRADRALYQSKHDGRNRTSLWSIKLEKNRLPTT